MMMVDHPVHPDHPVVVQPVRVDPGVNLQPAAGLEDEELGFPLQRGRLPIVKLAEYVFDGHLVFCNYDWTKLDFHLFSIGADD